MEQSHNEKKRRKSFAITLKERIQIRELLDKHFSYKEIAEILDRYQGTIGIEINRTGTRSSYNPYLAQEYYDSILVSRSKKNSETQKVKYHFAFNDLKKKVECLEMQIEIALDEIKKIKEE